MARAKKKSGSKGVTARKDVGEIRRPVSDELFQSCTLFLPPKSSIANFKTRPEVWILKDSARFHMCYPEDVMGDTRVKRESAVELPFKDVKSFKTVENRQGAQYLLFTMRTVIKSERGDEIGDSIFFYIDDEVDKKHFQSVVVDRIRLAEETVTRRASSEGGEKGGGESVKTTCKEDIDKASVTKPVRTQSLASKKARKTVNRVAFRTPTPEASRACTPEPTIVVPETPEFKLTNSIQPIVPPVQPSLTQAVTIEKVVQCNEVLTQQMQTEPHHTTTSASTLPPLLDEKINWKIKADMLGVPETYADNSIAIEIGECYQEVGRRLTARTVKRKVELEHQEADLRSNLQFAVDEGRERFVSKFKHFELEIQKRDKAIDARCTSLTNCLQNAIRACEEAQEPLRNDLTAVQSMIANVPSVSANL